MENQASFQGTKARVNWVRGGGGCCCFSSSCFPHHLQIKVLAVSRSPRGVILGTSPCKQQRDEVANSTSPAAQLGKAEASLWWGKKATSILDSLFIFLSRTPALEPGFSSQGKKTPKRVQFLTNQRVHLACSSRWRLQDILCFFTKDKKKNNPQKINSPGRKLPFLDYVPVLGFKKQTTPPLPTNLRGNSLGDINSCRHRSAGLQIHKDEAKPSTLVREDSKEGEKESIL